jgi:tyrosyl-tRNA synthetase
MSLIAELKSRNLIQDMIPGTDEQLDKEMTAAYIGFDPTADSLHVGSLLPITLLMRLQRAGHKPYALVGGATGMIGDPSGKSAERNLLDMDTIRKNCDGIRKQLEKFLDFDESRPNAAVMVNNYDWFKDFSFLDFIRDVGKHIPVNYMMAKDSVQKRLETGISFTEFTYQLIQGYDFYYLYNNHNIKLQMGGADQWGNMTTGTELIRRKGGGSAFAMTCPLVTKSDGTKFGKSEGGNIWLDPERTSPYEFYQFWYNQADADAERMAYIFSFRPLAEIEAMIAAHKGNEAARTLQTALAEELTTMVHGKEGLEAAQNATKILFGKNTIEALRSLDESSLLNMLQGVEKVNGLRETLAEGINLISFLAETGIFASKGAARKMIESGGMSINKEKVSGVDFMLKPEHLLNERYVLIQKGKKEYTLAIFN